MSCEKCAKDIDENGFYLNCSNCGDFCDEVCFMQYHDGGQGCVEKVLDN